MSCPNVCPALCVILLGLTAALAMPRRADAARIDQAHPAPANSLHYHLGGVMSGPIELTLDLDGGRFAIEEAWPPQTKTIVRQVGTLAGSVTRRMRRLAEAAVETGLESEACRLSTVPQPPIADAIRMMTITIQGRQTAAPDSIGCWSKAADDAASAAYADVHAAALGEVNAFRR